MGALLAVNQGSAEPLKMIVLKYQGKEKMGRRYWVGRKRDYL